VVGLQFVLEPLGVFAPPSGGVVKEVEDNAPAVIVYIAVMD